MVASLVLDHLVFATRDLERTSGWLSDVTGVAPTPGGPHVGFGTRNLLVSFGDGTYLEIIGPDPDQEEPSDPRPFGLDRLAGPGVVAWCARTMHIAAFVESVAGADTEYTPPMPMTRESSAGSLGWSLTLPTSDNPGGIVPFVIDWGTTPHPAATTEAVLDLTSFAVVHPDPADVAAALRRLGVTVEVVTGAQPGIRAAVRGAAGEVVLPNGTSHPSSQASSASS